MGAYNFLASGYLAMAVQFCAAASLPGQPGSPRPAEIKAIEDRILASRRAIRAGHFHIKRTYAYFDKEGVRIEDEFDTYLTEFFVREDLREGGTYSTRSFGTEHVYTYTDKVTGDAMTQLYIADLSRTDRKAAHFYVHEPLLLMFHPAWYQAASNLHMESYVGSPLREAFTVEEVTWEQQPAIKVSFTRTISSRSRVSYWVVPSLGYSIVRMQVNFSASRGKAYEDTVQASVRLVAPDIWFPKTVQYVRKVDGSLTMQEDLEIDLSDVNKPIDPAFFEPQAMNIPPGTRVNALESTLKRDPFGELKWDGKKVVQMTLEELGASTPRPHKSRATRTILLLASSVVLAAMVVFLFWRSYLPKSPVRPG